MDGNWGAWTDWSTCSTSCGEGRHSRIRMCDNPLPQYGGSNCVLNDTFLSNTDVNGGLKEIASQNCISGICPGTTDLIFWVLSIIYNTWLRIGLNKIQKLIYFRTIKIRSGGD